MHEAAMQNVLKLNLSVWDLEPQLISWVLMRKNMVFDRLPELGERITILTYPAGFERLFTYRDYRVYDEQGDQIAWSSSTWLLMDTQARRMTKIPPSILALNDQMPDPANCLPRAQGKFPKLVSASGSQIYKVNFYDLDFNNHLNNTLYIKWMLEALPDAILEDRQLTRLFIQYKAECRWKEKVVAEIEPLGEQTFLHRLKLASDNKELALAKSVWE
jgi:acyl-ACP thioesterase